MNARLGFLLVVLPGLASAQAVVEYAIPAGQAATAAAPARNVGKIIAAPFTNLTRILQNSDKSKPIPRRAITSSKLAPRRVVPSQIQPTETARKSLVLTLRPSSVSGPVEPKAAPAFEDPSGIGQAMDYAEILHRFGPPSLKLTTGPGEETLSYARKDLVVNALLRNGKVATVQKTAGADRLAAKVP
jgi:hypothetical protein